MAFFQRFCCLKILLMFLLFAFSHPLKAQILNLEQDTYGLSMGSAVVAIAGGTHAIEWNPAGIARSNVPMAQLGFGFDPYLSSFQFNTSVLYPLPDGTVFALSQFSDFPNASGSNSTYVGSVALPLNSSRDLLVGFNLKYLVLGSVSGLNQNGRGLGLDLGLSYDLRNPQGTIASFALAIKDVDTEIRFDNNDEQPLARTFVLGAAYQNIPDMRIEMDYDIIDQTLLDTSLHNRLRVGVERFFGQRFYSVRLGYDDLFNNDGYFTFGAGYHPSQPYEISYALRASTNNEGLAHYISFVYRFDDFVKKEPPAAKISPIESSSEINIGEISKLTEIQPTLGKPVSTVPLHKMNIQVEPSVFSPNGRQKTITVSFPEDQSKDIARWILVFRSEDQKNIRSIGGTGALQPTILWDGKDDDGNQPKDGKYQVVLRTYDKNNNLLSDDFESVELVTVISHLVMQANNVYFSNHQTKKIKSQLSFNILSSAPIELQNWKFQVIDATSTKSVFSKKGKFQLPKLINWNGRGLNYKPVPDGDYQCVFTALDKAGNTLTDTVKVVICSIPPSIKLEPENDLIDLKPGKVFNFNLSATDSIGIKNWIINLVDENKQEIKSFAGDGEPPKNITWDGHTTQGQAIDAGSLVKVVFSATDKAGNVTITKPTSLQVDYHPSSAAEQLSINLTTVYFGPMSSVLAEKSKKDIEKATSSVQNYITKSNIIVKGYVDSSETGDLIALSHNRALAVKKFLIKSLKIPENEIVAVGYANKETLSPQAVNPTESNQRQAIIMLATQQ